MILTSILCAILTFFMALLHLLLLFGVPIGEYVLGGTNKVIPLKKRWINVLLFIIFSIIGILYLNVGGVLNGVSLSRFITKLIMWIYTAFLAYAIIGNIFLTNSKKEKYLMIPASILGFITSILTVIKF